MELTEKEQDLISLAERMVEEWRQVMELDPIWEIPIEVVECDGKGGVYTADAQYYRAPILIDESFLEVDEEEFALGMSKIIPHELTHIVAVDFLRTAMIIAKDDKHLKEELRYRYEQFTTRFCKIITKLRHEVLKHESKGADTGAEE